MLKLVQADVKFNVRFGSGIQQRNFNLTAALYRFAANQTVKDKLSD